MGAAGNARIGDRTLSSSAGSEEPLRVGVLVDLALTSDAGGHVKCWQRLAEAAVDLADRLDLTVHFQGPQPQRIELSPSVRYELLPPVLSTARFVRDMPDHTDLARWHPQLARLLGTYDVIHTTDVFFCYARTATRYARTSRTPIVSSIHTNTPEYARITTTKLLERKLGCGLAYRAATDCLRLPHWVSGLLNHRLTKHLAAVTSSMASYAGVPDVDHCGGDSDISLRRGLDRTLFTPERRDRSWLEHRFQLPGDHLIAMYAGKLNAGKNVALLGPAIVGARDAGVPVHLICAGAGAERPALERALGSALTCCGPLPQTELARVYASADLFLFPSIIDESGNVGVEALASGLPMLLAAGSGIATRMRACSGLRVLPGNDPAAWTTAIVELAVAPERRRAMSRAACSYVEAHVPSWGEVLEQDLLPVWQAAAVRSA